MKIILSDNKDYESICHFIVFKCPQDHDEKCVRLFRWKCVKEIINLCMCNCHNISNYSDLKNDDSQNVSYKSVIEDNVVQYISK